ncbi:hypothetical protein [Lapidilactobacillus bayanensis]|uniref:hypothetical protein n=1 Tax=Lapidilactobacillus bayanensis TaxID=2485998 RepID=UPI000F7903A2|nr:hypothetical protein [Lapidilactobacillus bayanensis]
MKLTIEGTPAEIKNALQAICGSKERGVNVAEITNKIETFLKQKQTLDSKSSEETPWSLNLFFGGMQVGTIPLQLDQRLVFRGKPLNDKGSNSKGNI